MLPLCRHFSRACHSSFQPPFQAAHPWLQGMDRGGGSSAGPSHGAAFEVGLKLHTRAQLTGTVWCPLLQSQHTPRSPKPEQLWPDSAMDLRGSLRLRNGLCPGQIRGAPERGELLKASLRPLHLSPLTHQPGLESESPFCCCPGWGPAPRVPSGHAGGRGFPPPTSGGQQPAALGLCTAALPAAGKK